MFSCHQKLYFQFLSINFFLHVEDETRYSVHGRKKVAESESPCFLLGTVGEVKRQNQLSASTFAHPCGRDFDVPRSW